MPTRLVRRERTARPAAPLIIDGERPTSRRAVPAVRRARRRRGRRRAPRAPAPPWPDGTSRRTGTLPARRGEGRRLQLDRRRARSRRRRLADHGATVVRVESETPARHHAGTGAVQGRRVRPQPVSNFYGSFNTSKRSITIDLASAGGPAIARRLARWADVVIDSFRPGTMDRLGLGHEQIARRQPVGHHGHHLAARRGRAVVVAGRLRLPRRRHRRVHRPRRLARPRPRRPVDGVHRHDRAALPDHRHARRARPAGPDRRRAATSRGPSSRSACSSSPPSCSSSSSPAGSAHPQRQPRPAPRPPGRLPAAPARTSGAR